MLLESPPEWVSSPELVMYTQVEADGQTSELGTMKAPCESESRGSGRRGVDEEPFPVLPIA